MNILTKGLAKQSVTPARVITLCAMLALSGCAGNGFNTAIEENHTCNMPHSKQLTVAVEESRSTLRQLPCQQDYDSHFETLVAIAAGEPDGKNLETLGLHSQWMVKQGIISKKQGETMLRRYFSPQLVSLEYDSDFNTYSHCSMGARLPEINQALKQELEQKRKGLSAALGDNKSYQAAVREYQAVKLIMETTQKACQQAMR